MISLRFSVACFALGCATPCADAALVPLGTEPAVAVELTSDDESYASVAIYATDATVRNARWFDSYTTLEGTSETYRADDALPSEQPVGGLTVLLDDALLRLDRASGEVVTAVPVARAIDVATLSDGVAVASTSEGTLLVLDLPRNAVTNTFDVPSRLGARAGRIVALQENARADRALVGLDDDAVALVAPLAGTLERIALPGLTRCGEVGVLASSSAASLRIAVLCAGQTAADAGLALLTLEPGGTPQIAAILPAGTLFAGFLPRDSLVVLSGDRIAVRAESTASQALITIDLASSAVELLWNEPDERTLGEGAFVPTTGELLWPSTTAGILRFRMEAGVFLAEAIIATPSCANVRARRIRYLP